MYLDFYFFTYHIAKNRNINDIKKLIKPTSFSFITCMLQSGKDIDIKNGISYFYFFTLFTAQNANTRGKIEHTWPTSLSFVTY